MTAKKRDDKPVDNSEKGSDGELETLRDLIFGNQARDFTQRLNDLENNFSANQRELKALLNEKTSSVSDSSTKQTTTIRKELTQRIDKQRHDQTEQIEQVREALSAQISNTKKELLAELEKQNNQQIERLQALQAETRNRDDDLRQELLTLTAWLDDKKASRTNMGDMLIELGKQMQAVSHAKNFGAE